MPSFTIKLFVFFSECPSGWVDGGKLGCYYTASEASAMTYSNAKNYCKSLDKRARLAEIKTQEIQTFVEGLKDINSANWWWLGGTKQVKLF